MINFALTSRHQRRRAAWNAPGVTPSVRLKRGDEVRWRRKVGAIRYLGNGLARFLQKRYPTLEPAENDVPMRCHARLLAERPDDVMPVAKPCPKLFIALWLRGM